MSQKGIWVFVPDEENAAAPAVTFPANQFPSTSTIPSLPFEKGPKVKIIFDRKDGTTSQHEWHFGPSPYIYRAGSQRGFSVKADMERAFSRVEEQKQRTQQYLGRQHEHVQREQEWRQRGAEHQRQRIMEDYASYMRDYERQMQNMHTRMQDQHRWMVEQTGRMQEQAVLGVSSSFASIPPMPPMPSMPPLPPLPPMAPI
ncbi:hypothetical protein BC830DRAFT_1172888 [Chytriomyces sp. MP71]|nr:hypothetical protein BC830DRAFT_1172888 [Chytriomyces sp. MP71]